MIFSARGCGTLGDLCSKPRFGNKHFLSLFVALRGTGRPGSRPVPKRRSETASGAGVPLGHQRRQWNNFEMSLPPCAAKQKPQNPSGNSLYEGRKRGRAVGATCAPLGSTSPRPRPRSVAAARGLRGRARSQDALLNAVALRKGSRPLRF